MIKKLATLFVAAVLCLCGAAHAAFIDISFTYRVDFADVPFGSDIGLPTGSLFSGTAHFDSANLGNAGPDQVMIVPGSGDTFTLNLGIFTFSEADDLLGGPILQISNGEVAGLMFDAQFAIASGSSAGGYFVHAFADQVQVCTLGTCDAQDIKLSATLVPAPASIALVLAGLGFIGRFRRRR